MSGGGAEEVAIATWSFELSCARDRSRTAAHRRRSTVVTALQYHWMMNPRLVIAPRAPVVSSWRAAHLLSLAR